MKNNIFTFTFSLLYFFAGSVGVHHLRVQEERAQSGHEEVEQPLQHDRQANVQ